MDMGRLLIGLLCDDGVILVSRYGHDYKHHTDANGKYYMIDGGQEDYFRHSLTGFLIHTEDGITVHDYFPSNRPKRRRTKGLARPKH